MTKEEFRQRFCDIVPIQKHSRMMDRVINLVKQYADEYVEYVEKDRLDQLEEKIAKLSMQIDELKGESVVADSDINSPLKDTERELIRQALVRNGGNRVATANELGIAERTLYRKLKVYNLVKI